MPGVLTKVGVVYNSRIVEAEGVAANAARQLEGVCATWQCTALEIGDHQADIASSDLVITVGGDGTILRLAEVASPHGVEILGINMGRVGFMAELSVDEANSGLLAFLKEPGLWTEERYMLQVDKLRSPDFTEVENSFHALNDVVVGRGAVPRLVRIDASVNNVFLSHFSADALIMATATGSTGYAYAAGGPILYPESSEILLTPVAAHISFSGALVLPGSATLALTVHTNYRAVLSVDGHRDLELKGGDVIRVRQSPYRTRFLRRAPADHFYTILRERLGLDRGSDRFHRL